MTERQRIVRAACEDFPSHATQTIAKALFKKYPREFISFTSARQAVQSMRGEHKGGSDKQPVARLPAMPPSAATPWLPVELVTKRCGILSDIHVPYHDRKAVEVAVKHLMKERIDTLLLNGDVLDFYQISRFDKSSNRPTVKQELSMARKLVEYLRSRLPKARIVWKLGNHEERWEHYLSQRAPEIFELTFDTWEKNAGVEENGIEVVRDGKMILIGKLPVLHGHELPKGMINPVNPARGAFLRTLDNILVSHHHRTSEHTERTMMGRTISARSMGCLCDLTPDYSRVNRWDHGFATVEVSNDGGYHVQLKKIINGKPY